MKLAWKEIRFNLKKYLLIEILIIFMIFMVMFLSGLANGLGRAVSSGIENMDTTQFIISTDAEKLISVSRLDKEILEQIKSSNDSKAALDIQRMNLSIKGHSEKLDVSYFAINTEEFLNPEVIKGSKLTKDQYGIVLDDAFIEEGIAVGDTLVDAASGIELTVTGFTKDAMYGHIPVGFISMDTFTDIQTAINPNYELKYHVIALQGDKVVDLSNDGIEQVDKATIIKNIPSYQAEQLTINMILWVLVFVSAAILDVFFYIITLQKLKQFGVMKAIGMRMGEILTIQFSQVVILAGFGVICGNVLTYLMALMLPKSMPFYLNQANTGVISIAFVVIAICSSLISATQIAKVDPVKIIGGNEE
jgi:putative ABC transport system permease protein